MNILNQKEITFKDLERFFFEMGCKIAKGFLQEFLEQTDKQLAEDRNKKELRHGGKKITTLKTLMGEVTVKRNVYRKTDENGQVQHMYLLDQFLGFETIGLISPNLAEKILELSCQKSYRQVAQTISELTNQTISHQGVWDVIQTAGQRQKKAEYEEIKAYKNHQLNGTKEVPVLFEEADGVWLSMQGRSRKKRGNGRKELKIGIAYEGWAPRYPSSQEYKTIGKMVYAGYHKPSEFQELREAKVATKYNVDEIKYRI